MRQAHNHNRNSKPDNNYIGRVQYPIPGDSSHYKGYGKRHYWGRIRGAYGLQDSEAEYHPPVVRNRYQGSVEHINRREYRSLDLGQMNSEDSRELGKTNHRPFKPQRLLELTINPQQISLDSLKRVRVPQTTKAAPREELLKEMSQTPAEEPARRLHIPDEAQRRVRTELETQKQPIDQQKDFDYRENPFLVNKRSDYFRLLSSERLITQPKLPLLENPSSPPVKHYQSDRLRPQPQPLGSEYRNSYSLNKPAEKPLMPLRNYLRRISPSFTSSMNNPLADAYQQVQLIIGKR